MSKADHKRHQSIEDRVAALEAAVHPQSPAPTSVLGAIPKALGLKPKSPKSKKE